MGKKLEIFLVYLKLGLTSFGGPVAHLGYFREEFIVKRKWLKEQGYADVVALCQFLPGPTSSQVGFVIGLLRGGISGGLIAWLAFTGPSVLLMFCFAYGVELFSGEAESGILHGLKIAAVAIVANAVWGMGNKLCIEKSTITIAFISAIAILLWQGALTQLVVIGVGGFIGWGLFLEKKNLGKTASSLSFKIDKKLSYICLATFISMLLLLPIIVVALDDKLLEIFSGFFRSGSLVFGGGHVLLPLLEETVVSTDWVSKSDFLAGYGFAQALPGPLFSFAAYIGAVMDDVPNGVVCGLWCLIAIFIPSFLLLIGILPFWENLRKKNWAQAVLKGTNASVVGLVLAALYDPVWVNAITEVKDFALDLGLFCLLVFWKCPSWLVVLCAAVSGAYWF